MTGVPNRRRGAVGTAVVGACLFALLREGSTTSALVGQRLEHHPPSTECRLVTVGRPHPPTSAPMPFIQVHRAANHDSENVLLYPPLLPLCSLGATGGGGCVACICAAVVKRKCVSRQVITGLVSAARSNASGSHRAHPSIYASAVLEGVASLLPCTTLITGPVRPTGHQQPVLSSRVRHAVHSLLSQSQDQGASSTSFVVGVSDGGASPVDTYALDKGLLGFPVHLAAGSQQVVLYATLGAAVFTRKGATFVLVREGPGSASPSGSSISRCWRRVETNGGGWFLAQGTSPLPAADFVAEGTGATPLLVRRLASLPVPWVVARAAGKDRSVTA